MKMRYENNIRILTDILGHFFYLGGCHFTTDIKMSPHSTELTVTGRIKDLSSAQVDHLKRLLSIPRQKDMEQNYWNLSGEEEIDGELSLAGMMVDTAEVTYDGSLLIVRVERYEEKESI